MTHYGKRGISRLTKEQVLEIQSKYKPGIYTQDMLAKEYNTNQYIVCKIVNNKYDLENIWKS